ncbi:MAG: hypothetical protein KDC39_07010 [Actinobacteria bacterium]|mgnify:CR=1 FL=1|nr:hypothetical protein [Actinomycetota bacterium]
MRRLIATMSVAGVLLAGVAMTSAAAGEVEGQRLQRADATVVGAAASRNLFNGVWDTNHGRITFLQVGADVLGTYPWSGAGLIRGEVKGTRMSGTWTDGQGNGTYRINLKQRGLFKGKYWDANGDFIGRWKGEQKKRTAKLRFKGYADNVRVADGLQGDWQLGKARIQGRVKFSDKGTFTGAARDTDDQYYTDDHSINVQVTEVRNIAVSSRGLTFTLGVRVVNTARPDICPVGSTGTITVADNPVLVSSSNTKPQNSDSIASTYDGANCPTHTHGWNNTDGGVRTSPTWGGFPGGGQWAVVTL